MSLGVAGEHREGCTRRPTCLHSLIHGTKTRKETLKSLKYTVKRSGSSSGSKASSISHRSKSSCGPKASSSANSILQFENYPAIRLP